MTSIEGTVLEINFRNDENGWTVLALDFRGELTTAVGLMPHIHEGEYVRLFGAWTEHRIYGRQFAATSMETHLPNTAESIRLFLASGLLKGVGDVLAGRIVDKFGEDTFDIIENAPELLAEIKGISKRLAKSIAESFMEHVGIKQIVIDLQSLGLSVRQAFRAFERYGAAAAVLIQENPYRMIDDITGIGFERADRIAGNIGIDKTSEYRIDMGIKHVLVCAMNDGHTCLPRAELLWRASKILDVGEPLIEPRISALTLSGDIVQKYVNSTPAIFLITAYIAETDVARRLFILSRTSPRISIDDAAAAYSRYIGGAPISEEQERAVLAALSGQVVVITGGPGTGKTTIIKAILSIFEMNGITTALCAPTGRAAKRIEQSSGREAKTIHRLLEYGIGDDEEFGNGTRFIRNEENPLDAEAVVVDEASMVDIFLMRSLLCALSDGTRLIIVGDADQLPSVGPGNVLRDIINSALFPILKLTKFYRQKEGGSIVENAHRVNNGQNPELYITGDFIFLPENEPERVIDTIKKLLTQGELPGKYDILEQTQILCPVKKGLLGVHNINSEIRELLNPRLASRPEVNVRDTTYRMGDKIMQTKNNYSMEWYYTDDTHFYNKGYGVFNGDLGRIVCIDNDAKEATIRFDSNREAVYSFHELEQIEHAYAVTVHKSQGSEFPVVILPLFSGGGRFLSRNLLYTALTRAMEKVIIIGQKNTVEYMVANNRILGRYTTLDYEIKEIGEIMGGVGCL
ncbi:MAG: ATP-dependent RecD-like DNA helicase [Christensenellales bacterium]